MSERPSTKLRELASKLTDVVSNDIIHNVKLGILSVANELDKQTIPIVKQQDIDDILNEIDEQENKFDEFNSEEYEKIIERIKRILFMHGTSVSGSYHQKLNEQSWIFLFRSPTNEETDKPPFPIDTRVITDQELIQIFNQIPDRIMGRMYGTEEQLKNLFKEDIPKEIQKRYQENTIHDPRFR
eukprot:211689_1